MPRKNFREPSKQKIYSVSIIPTGLCNLQCSYCFEKKNLMDNKVMDLDVAKGAISRYLCAENDFEAVVIDFFGGEPLLAFPFIQKVVDWTISQKWPKKYHFSLGTNGTLLTDEIKNWLQEHREHLTVSFSINGTKQAHDLTRDNSYDLLSPHIPFFLENWPDQPAKMTICAETIPYVADSIIELEEMGLFFTANIAFENIWGTPEKAERLLNIYEEQLMRLVDYYAARPHLIPVYRILDSLPSSLGIPGTGQDQGDCTRFCGAGHEMVVVDVDGQTYPCHRFIPWVTGKPAPKGPTNNQSHWQSDKCLNCKILQSCPTCAGYNWEMNEDTSIRTTFHCEATKIEVLAAAKLVARKLEKLKMPVLESLLPREKAKLKKYLDVIWEFIENGL